MNTPHLKSLYKKYREQLSDDTLVMQDDIINLLITIESEISGILANTTVSESRQRRYRIDNTTPNVFHKKLATEAQVMENTIGTPPLYTTYAGADSTQTKNIGKLLKNESYEIICESLGIHYRIHTDGREKPFVPTDKNRIKTIQIGSGNGWENTRQEPKFLEFLALLRNIKTPDGGYIDPRDITVDLQSTTPDDMIRLLPYMVIRIPRLSRTILIDEQIGEATFVLQGMVDLDIIRETDKKWLEVYQGAKRVIYDASWGENITQYLKNNWDLVDPNTPTMNIPTPRTNMDRASLFMDKEIILKDLTEFARVGEVDIAELTVSTPKSNTEIILSNGVKIKWETYLRNASGSLLGTQNKNKDNPHRYAKALDKLCELIDVERNKREFLTAEYFEVGNREHILKDLIEFARVGGVTLMKLSAKKPEIGMKITLWNDRQVTWQTYLNNASSFLLGTKYDNKENAHRKADALDMLFELIGVERNKRETLTQEYFDIGNRENILKDLTEFARVGGVDIAELTKSTPKWDTIIILSNGIRMTWNTYLNNASRFLLETQQKNEENPPRKAEALDKLCELIDVERNKREALTTEYYKIGNKENILKDLTEFAKAGEISIRELSTGRPKWNTEVILTNEIQMTWGTYLINASQYILGTKYRDITNLHRKAEALDKLFKLIGVVRTKKERNINSKNPD